MGSFSGLNIKTRGRMIYLSKIRETFQAQFYSQRFFAHFNMFANYFYEKSAEKRLRMFFSVSSRLLIVVDPPFGGLASPIARTIQSLIDVHKNSYTGTSDDVRSNCMWIFPYFFQSKLKECYPQMNMADYQVATKIIPLAVSRNVVGFNF